MDGWMEDGKEGKLAGTANLFEAVVGREGPGLGTMTEGSESRVTVTALSTGGQGEDRLGPGSLLGPLVSCAPPLAWGSIPLPHNLPYSPLFPPLSGLSAPLPFQ